MFLVSRGGYHLPEHSKGYNHKSKLIRNPLDRHATARDDGDGLP